MTNGAGTDEVRNEVLRSQGGRFRLLLAATAVARVEQEVDRLWRDSIVVDDADVWGRLAEASHALHRAARLLDRGDHAIG